MEVKEKKKKKELNSNFAAKFHYFRLNRSRQIIVNEYKHAIPVKLKCLSAIRVNYCLYNLGALSSISPVRTLNCSVANSKMKKKKIK